MPRLHHIPKLVLVASLAVPLTWGAEPVRVSIDTTEKREPISKYIYGQFIEHLGRCIYGGLWSEVLEDRKFYYPVTGEAPAWEMFKPSDRSWDGEGHPYELLVRSPWMILGEKKAVSMVTEDSYVGDHTPRIQLAGDGTPRGIQQERIGLVSGRQYTGRIILAGDGSAVPIEVSLVWGGGANDRHTVVIDQLADGYNKYPLKFTAGNSTDNGRLEIVGKGSGSFLIGTVSVMPADNVYGWRSDTLALLKELNSPVYRWPGGNFVSGYDWKDGIGDPDRRPPRKNPAWKGVEHNDVGIHEFLDLCREIDTEPFVAVNTGLGGAEAAAEWLEYTNGSVDTKMGKLRAENGHPKSWGVKWWAIGNEMYGDWQLGHMPLSEYVTKHNRVVEAMRKVDPSIEPIAVGAAGEWSQEMMNTCSEHMSLISEHIYWQDTDDVESHVAQMAERIKKVADTHRDYRKKLSSLKGKDIRIAMDEWNYWYGANEFGELGVRYFLQDALGIAVGLHEFFRNSDLYYMANYAQTVNVIGAIKTTDTEAEMETTGLVLKLYREHFGTDPLAVAAGHSPMDISAALTSDGTALTIGIVNPTDETSHLELDVKGAAPTGRGRKWVITGSGKWAHNHPGKPRQVDIAESSFAQLNDATDIASLSVTLLELGLK